MMDWSNILFCWKCQPIGAKRTPWELTKFLQKFILKKDGLFFVCPTCGHNRWMGQVYMKGD